MFTGIVQGVSTIKSISDAEELRTFTLDFPPNFADDLTVGASVSVDGVCLTVTQVLSCSSAKFDVVLQSLSVTTLGGLALGTRMNTERERQKTGLRLEVIHFQGTSTSRPKSKASALQ